MALPVNLFGIPIKPPPPTPPTPPTTPTPAPTYSPTQVAQNIQQKVQQAEATGKTYAEVANVSPTPPTPPTTPTPAPTYSPTQVAQNIQQKVQQAEATGKTYAEVANVSPTPPTPPTTPTPAPTYSPTQVAQNIQQKVQQVEVANVKVVEPSNIIYVLKTTNPDKFTVRVDNGDNTYKQVQMSRQEIIDAGGEIPVVGEAWKEINNPLSNKMFSTPNAITETDINNAYKELGLEIPDFISAPRNKKNMILDGDNAGMLDGFFDEDGIALYEHPGQFSNVESAIKYENTIKDPIAKEAWENAFVAYWGKLPSEIVYTLPNDKEKAISALGYKSVDDPELVALLERYKSNPEAEEFKTEANGGTMSIAKKTLLSFLADVPYDAVKDYQSSIIRVGTDITSGTFSQMVASEYARKHNMSFADVSQMIRDAVNGKENANVNKLSASEKEAFNNLVTRWSAGADYITKTEADNIKELDPEGYDLLLKKGLDAYQLRQETIASSFEPYVLATGADGSKQYGLMKMVDAYNKNELSKKQIELILGKDALDKILKISDEVNSIKKDFESQIVDTLPPNLQEDYRKGLSKNNLDEFQENYLSYITSQQERYQKYQDAVDTLTELGYKKIIPSYSPTQVAQNIQQKVQQAEATGKTYAEVANVSPTPPTPHNLGNAPISTQEQATQFVEGGVVYYDIPSYLRDTKTKDYKVNPVSVLVLENLFGGDKEAAKPIIDSAQKQLDYLSTTINHLQNDKLDNAQVEALRKALIGVVGQPFNADEAWFLNADDLMKLRAEAPELQRELDDALVKTNAEQSLKEFLGKLSQGDLEKVADIWSYDVERYSPFAQTVTAYNEAINKTPLAKWAKMPVYFTPVGMGLAATESVAGLVSPYTISDEAIVRQIDDNYTYLNSTDKLDAEVNDILAKALKDNDIKVDEENALQTYKSLDDSQKTKVIKEYTRNMLGLDPSVMDKIMTGAMVIAAAIGFKGQVLNPIVSNIISKYGIKAPEFLKSLNKLSDLGSRVLHVPITGLFIAGSVPTITNPKVALDDKVMAIVFDFMMLRGLGGGLIGATKVGFKRPTTEISPKIPSIEMAVDKVTSKVASPEVLIDISLSARRSANLHDISYNFGEAVAYMKNIPTATVKALSLAILNTTETMSRAGQVLRLNMANMTDAVLRSVSQTMLEASESLNALYTAVRNGTITDAMAREISGKLLQANESINDVINSVKTGISETYDATLKGLSKSLLDTSENINSIIKSIKETGGKLTDEALSNISKGLLDAEEWIGKTSELLKTKYSELTDEAIRNLSEDLLNISDKITSVKDYIAKGELTDAMLRGLSEQLLKVSDSSNSAWEVIKTKVSDVTDATLRGVSEKMLETSESVENAIKSVKDTAGKFTDNTIKDLSKALLDISELVNKTIENVNTKYNQVSDAILKDVSLRLLEISNKLNEIYQSVIDGTITDAMLRGLSEQLMSVSDFTNGALNTLKTKYEAITDKLLRDTSKQLLEVSDNFNKVITALKKAPSDARDGILRQISEQSLKANEALTNTVNHIKNAVGNANDAVILKLSQGLLDASESLTKMYDYIAKGELTDDILRNTSKQLMKVSDTINQSREVVKALAQGVWEYTTEILPENIKAGIRSPYYKAIDTLSSDISEISSGFKDAMSGKPKADHWVRFAQERNRALEDNMEAVAGVTTQQAKKDLEETPEYDIDESRWQLTGIIPKTYRAIEARISPRTSAGHVYALTADVGRENIPKGMSQLTARQLTQDVEQAQLTSKIPANRVRALEGTGLQEDGTIEVNKLPNGTIDVVFKTRDGDVWGRVSGMQRVLGDVLYNGTANGNVILAQILKNGIEKTYKTATPQEKVLLDNLMKNGADEIAFSYDPNAYDSVLKKFINNPEYKDILKKVNDNAYHEVRDYYVNTAGEKVPVSRAFEWESQQIAQAFTARGHGDPVVAPMVFATRTTPKDFLETMPDKPLDNRANAMRKAFEEMNKSGLLDKDKIYNIFKVYQGQVEYELVKPLGFETSVAKPTSYAGGENALFPSTFVTSMFDYHGLGHQIRTGDKIPIIWMTTKNAKESGLGVPTRGEIYLGKILGDLTLARQRLPWNWRFREEDKYSEDDVTVNNPLMSGIKQITLKARPEDAEAGRVSAIIRDNNGRVLLVKTKGGSTYDLPGGGVNKRGIGGIIKEHPDNAMKAEIWEELGLNTDKLNYIGTIESRFTNKSPKENFRIYEADVSGKIKDAGVEVADYIWWDGKKDVKLSEFTKEALQRASERATEIDELVAKDVYTNIADTLMKKYGKSKAPDWDSIYEKIRNKNHIVFDLDKTLVDSNGKLLKGAKEFVDRLKKEGKQVSLWTHSTSERANRILDRAGLSNYFDNVVTREQYEPTGKNPNAFKDINKIKGDVLVDDRFEGFIKEADIVNEIKQKVDSGETQKEINNNEKRINEILEELNKTTEQKRKQQLMEELDQLNIDNIITKKEADIAKDIDNIKQEAKEKGINEDELIRDKLMDRVIEDIDPYRDARRELRYRREKYPEQELILAERDRLPIETDESRKLLDYGLEDYTKSSDEDMESFAKSFDERELGLKEKREEPVLKITKEEEPVTTEPEEEITPTELEEEKIPPQKPEEEIIPPPPEKEIIPPPPEKEIIPPPPFKGFIKARDSSGKEVDLEIKPGSVVWIQGRPKAKGSGNAPMYKISLPPYTDETLYTSRENPPGYKDMGWEGKGSARASIQCFPKGTKILIRQKRLNNNQYNRKSSYSYVPSDMAIDKIKIGDYALSYNEKTGEKEFKEIKNIFKRQTDKFVKIYLFNGNEIICTPEHPIAINVKGKIEWIEAKELQNGYEILQYQYSGLYMRLSQIPNKGKTLEEIYGEEKGKEIKRKISEHHSRHNLGRIFSEEHRRRIGEKSRGRQFTLESRAKMSHSNKIRWDKDNGKERKERSEIFKAKWRDLKYSQATLLKMGVKFNKHEQLLSLILDHICPKEFKYNGDGNLGLSFDGIHPDFVNVNGKKKVIEVFAEHWKVVKYGSVENYIKLRSERFKNIGYQSLFIKNKEFNDLETLQHKIMNFVYNPKTELVKVVKIETIYKELQDVYNLEVQDNNNYFVYGILVHNCVGGNPPTDIENLDLGFVKINIRFASGEPLIEFVQDEDANAGQKSQTIGMGRGQIPVEDWQEAKDRGVKYKDFIKQYRSGTKSAPQSLIEEIGIAEEKPRDKMQELARLIIQASDEEKQAQEEESQRFLEEAKKPAKNWWDEPMYENIGQTSNARYYRGRRIPSANIEVDI